MNQKYSRYAKYPVKARRYRHPAISPDQAQGNALLAFAVIMTAALIFVYAATNGFNA